MVTFSVPGLGRLYDAYLYPDDGPRPRFDAPLGEPALTPADGVSWRVFANPVTLFVGGVLAVILELSLPSVRHGVWDHSTFAQDPRERLRRTGLAAMVTIYAGRSVALPMIGRVNRIHAGIKGVTDRGEPYRADDDRLLTWVHATAAFGFARAYDALTMPLSPSEWDALFTEAKPVATAYGALSAPASFAGWEDLLTRTAPDLEGSDVLDTFLGLMANRTVLPRAAKPLQAPLVRVAASLVPAPVAGRIGLPRKLKVRATDWSLARFAARTAAQLALPESPPALARRRLGIVRSTTGGTPPTVAARLGGDRK
ncbi:oxygenase MpaB family protein [Parvularcula dongshanensis]|uniref:Uncharacterized protein (DUF2236 family) n=1 Tax=Parvularcula dongshanensis TaxID=1173995 RepID=A0A840I5P3_9PROT|nr:oxygenase MpaB family protein [Parvularcula dongshanensis]MBB4659722.1 uncharacterized protein (DUF2236 family) [Parvularcula dongshanensis]